MNQSELFEQAMKRPKNFHNLPEEDHWAIDRQLGILDWDGSCPHQKAFNQKGKFIGPCSECEERYWKAHDERDKS